MATYAIGDVHGCWRTLQELLRQLRFDGSTDRLWFTGDLVNRGPGSLDVLRFVVGLGDAAVTVLGNHDVHLLACSAGLSVPRAGDTLDAVLSAPDRDELVGWLRRRPLLHRDGPWVLVHAGLLPQWSIDEAERQARELERELARPDGDWLLRRRGKGAPGPWGPELPRMVRLRASFAAMTRMRICEADGTMHLGFTGPPGEIPGRAFPWYDVPNRLSRGATVIFGHWAALGLYRERGVIALDSGCVWGGALSAVRLDDGRLTQTESRDTGST